MRKIKVCAGIGDNIWLLMKLINSGEKFDFQLPDGKPQRGKQIFDLLPQVANSAEYVPGLSYRTLKANNIQNRKKNWKQITEEDFYLTCNEHLETGHRLELFLPDLPISFKLDYDTADSIERIQEQFPGTKEYIGIYGSAYSTTRAWGFWDEKKWFDLIRMVHARNPDYVFVIIGAEWDIDLGRNLVELLRLHDIPHINTIGQSLGDVVEIMKRLKYFFSFPSGLGIMAPTVSCQVTMFYPPHLVKMINAWASPEDIETGAYKGCLFCEPEAIFKWTVENRKL